jgi:hypothetical protein
MKKKFKLKTMLCAMTVMGISSVIAPSVMAEEIPDVISGNVETGVSVRNIERGWLYTQMEDGHVYKRLWNYTYGCWESDWILVA